MTEIPLAQSYNVHNEESVVKPRQRVSDHDKVLPQLGWWRTSHINAHFLSQPPDKIVWLGATQATNKQEKIILGSSK